MAAGAGRRYGRPKALVQWGDRLLVEHAFAALRAGGCDPVVVVLGAAAAQVRATAAMPGAIVVDNPHWSAGMGSSLRAGLAALQATAAPAAVVLLVDTPGIGAAAVRRLGELAGPAALAQATYRGEPGHPVVLGRDHWPGVAAAATGDRGARSYLVAHAAAVRTVPCDDAADPADLDVPVPPPGPLSAPPPGPPAAPR